jgi:2,3-diketo-5-methylthio-1-phosphopentane phosphatase
MSAERRVYLLDVEGTVAPISLVTEQLFPYARAHFAIFLEQNAGNPEVESDLALLAEENRAESESEVPHISSLEPAQQLRAPSGYPGPTSGPGSRLASGERVGNKEAALAYLLWLMDRDRKSTALKSLQGKIWKAGFESGELKGTLFPDVPQALARWAAHGRVAIYSSGSTSAQQLLFRYSIFGDLTNIIAAYFDTRTGAKTASASYAAIAAAMAVEPHQVCFFSDVVRELDPAREAGLETRLVIRDGNAPVDDTHGHIAIESFDSIA